MAGQGHGSIKPRGVFRHANVPCHMLQGIHRPVLTARTGILDGLELRALNARLSSLGFTSRQQGVEEVAGCTP